MQQTLQTTIQLKFACSTVNTNHRCTQLQCSRNTFGITQTYGLPQTKPTERVTSFFTSYYLAHQPYQMLSAPLIQRLSTVP